MSERAWTCGFLYLSEHAGFFLLKAAFPSHLSKVLHRGHVIVWVPPEHCSVSTLQHKAPLGDSCCDVVLCNSA